MGQKTQWVGLYKPYHSAAKVLPGLVGPVTGELDECHIADSLIRNIRLPKETPKRGEGCQVGVGTPPVPTASLGWARI